MIFKLSDAATKLGIHRQTLWNYVKANKIKSIRAKNGIIRNSIKIGVVV